MTSNSTGRSIFITGGGSGIGRAAALHFAARGWFVGVADINEAGMAETLGQIAGDAKWSGKLDVRDRKGWDEALAAFAAAAGGRIDALVNNAGIHIARSFLDHEPADFQRLLDVNLFGVIHMTQAVLPAMLERGYGRIVNIASTAGRWGSRNQAGYNVSKHAVLGLTRCVALETAARGVTVNAICPGFVDTDMLSGIKQDYGRMGIDAEAAIGAFLAQKVPLGRALRVDEIAGLAVFLASPASSGMTGQSLTIDGGMLTA